MMYNLVSELTAWHNEHCFVIIEVPTNIKEEAAFGTQLSHKDVYYLDELTPDKAIAFLREFGEWFIHDGLSNFGIGLHSGGNEIVLGKYNVLTVYTKSPQKYTKFFEAHDIPEVFNLKTACNLYKKEHCCPQTTVLKNQFQ